MPNWCENELTVTGARADLEAFCAAISLKEDGTYASLKDTFLPTPRELEFCTGGAEIDGVQVDAWYEHTINGTVIRTPVTKTAKAHFLKQYGAANWYDWNIKYWGCKWGESEARAERRPHSLWLRFDTPWGAPDPGIATISGRFPALRFTLRYWEGGSAFQGTSVFKGGAVIKAVSKTYRGPRGG